MMIMMMMMYDLYTNSGLKKVIHLKDKVVPSNRLECRIATP